MRTFLMKMFQKNTKTCEHCGCGINPKKDAAICLHGEENGIPFETYICEPCCEKICFEYDEVEGLEVAEDRDSYPE